MKTKIINLLKKILRKFGYTLVKKDIHDRLNHLDFRIKQFELQNYKFQSVGNYTISKDDCSLEHLNYLKKILAENMINEMIKHELFEYHAEKIKTPYPDIVEVKIFMNTTIYKGNLSKEKSFSKMVEQLNLI
jgi:hypothetical protein